MPHMYPQLSLNNQATNQQPRYMQAACENLPDHSVLTVWGWAPKGNAYIISVPQPDKNKSSNGILKIYPSGGFIHTLNLKWVQQTWRQRNAFSWLLICSSHTMKMKRFRRTVYQHYTTVIYYNGHYCNETAGCNIWQYFLNQQSINWL